LSESVEIRFAEPSDVDTLFSLIVGLARFEREPDAVVGTPALLREALFGRSPSAEALLAQVEREPAGFALFHGSFSTWECRPGIWLEDLFVVDEHRGAGVGEALLRRLAAITVERGSTRLEWMVLDWNSPALSFYEKHGAEVLADWRVHRVSGSDLLSLGRPQR
jgi:GNAT superfamily N-acetyltransferase